MNTHVHGVVTIAGDVSTQKNAQYGTIRTQNRRRFLQLKSTCHFAKVDTRFPQAIDGSIFGTELDPLDLTGMEREAAKQLRGVFTLNLYVTGLTVALIAVLNVCREQKIKVTLYHYNRETGNYYPQEVK